MDTVTYPDAQVEQAIDQHFVPLKIDMLARHPDFKAASLNQRVIWAPTIIFTDAAHRELRRYVGWLPPRSFLAELALVRALADFNRGQFEPARQGFQTILETFQGTSLEPEALYWAGIAGFLAGNRDKQALATAWQRLAREFPHTRWGTHASVIEDA